MLGFTLITCILDVEHPANFLPIMSSAPMKPRQRVKQRTALHCQCTRAAFISVIYVCSVMRKQICIVVCNASVKRNDSLFVLIPNEVTEPERREMWLRATYRGITSACTNMWRPRSQYHYECSSHFTSGGRYQHSHCHDIFSAQLAAHQA